MYLVKPMGQLLGCKPWGRCLVLTLVAPSLYPYPQSSIKSLWRSVDPTTTHPVCFVLVSRMSLLPVWPYFHQSVHVVPLVVFVPSALPSPVCTTHVPSGVAASTLTILSLFPPSSIYLSSFACSSCHTITSFPLSPKLLSPLVDLLWTYNFVLPLYCGKYFSCLCHTQECYPLLLVLY